MRLIREVRCFPSGESRLAGAGDSWAGSPGCGGFEMFWVLRATVEGAIDERTGYLCDIKEIDAILRTVAVPALLKCTEMIDITALPVPAALRNVFPTIVRRWPARGSLVRLQLAVSPYLVFTVQAENRAMIQITQSFEFSAAHRLYCKDLSDAENRRMFGKCSNPHGHGHNYVLEVTVGGTPDEETGTIIQLSEMQKLVHECVIRPFDHKNLNVQVADFRSLNPSVENIAQVIFTRLEHVFESCRLIKVRVWETPKTCAEYTGQPDGV